jgi:hypothetical protein
LSRITELTHEFVESLPEKLEEGKIYVSIKFRTAGHRCCCGCGKEIITPIRPTKWTLIFNGETVSLKPSIGNWQLKCKSHYWITENKVHWDTQWSHQEIIESRTADAKWRQNYNQEKSNVSDRSHSIKIEAKKKKAKGRKTFLERLKFWSR